MSIKHADSVDAYCAYTQAACDVQAAIENLSEWAQSLPTPNEAGEIPGADYGDLARLSHVRAMLADVVRFVDSATSCTR